MIALDLGVREDESSEREIRRDDLLYLSRGLKFLRHWPIEKLQDNPTASSIYYFHRNTVLVRDSNNSDWIYVVLKGSLSVLKKLKRFNTGPDKDKPDSKTKGKKRFNQDDRESITLSALDSSKRQRRRGQWSGPAQESLPVLKEDQFKSTFELETRLAQSLPGYINLKDRLLSLDYDKIIKNYQSRLLVKSRQSSSEKSAPKGDVVALHQFHVGDVQIEGNTNVQTKHQDSKDVFLPDIEITNKVIQHQKSESVEDSSTDNEESSDRTDTSGTQSNAENFRHISETEVTYEKCQNNYETEVSTEKCVNSPDPDVSSDSYLQTSKSIQADDRKQLNRMAVIKSLKGAYLAAARLKKPEPNTVDVITDSSTGSENLSDPSNENEELSLSQRIDKLQLRYQLAIIGREGRKTIAEELDQKGRRDYKVTEADLDPIFVQLQVLERGQYFGVVQLVYVDEPSLSVVSNGAECLVISKKLFRTWASDKCWRHLRLTECPYPMDEELTRKLHEEIEWRAASSALYKEIHTGILLRKSKLKQFHPAYIGEHCFRTGPV